MYACTIKTEQTQLKNLENHIQNLNHSSKNWVGAQKDQKYDTHTKGERERELLGSWVQVSCIWNSCWRVRGSEAVAWRRAGSCIHSWYFGTCASMYGTIITFFPSKLTLFFSIFFLLCNTPPHSLLSLSNSVSHTDWSERQSSLLFCSPQNDCRFRTRLTF